MTKQAPLDVLTALKKNFSSRQSSSSMLLAATVLEYALQLSLPILLVRILAPAEFGAYRLVWLVATTAAAIFPLYMPQALNYFVPRIPKHQHADLAGNLVLAMIVSALSGLLALHLIWPALESDFNSVEGELSQPLMLAFTGLWILSSMLDVVMLANGRVATHSKSIASMAFIRTAAIGICVALAGTVNAILAGLVAISLLRTIIAVTFMWRCMGLRLRAPNWALLSQQVAFAAPFALGNSFFLLRGQADQWIVAQELGVTALALLSVAAIVPGLVNFIRTPLINAAIPQLSQSIAMGAIDATVRDIRRTAHWLSLFLLPVLGGLFVCAPHICAILYTESYRDASGPMRVYIVGQAFLVISAGHLLPLLSRRRAALYISALALAVSVVVGFAGLKAFGLTGAALGSVAALVFGEVCALFTAAHALRVSPATLIGLRFQLVLAAVVFTSVLTALVVSSIAFDADSLGTQMIIQGTVYIAVFGALAMLLRTYGGVLDIIGTLIPAQAAGKPEAAL